ncbi:gluconokinase [Evansella cellulosilytica]|uniref:Carbohydrate kinase, FGGY-like protein n=1 Tax=Evansella cellulosilytica (strain ATCC 21833 / DSM 2522 / FERM P-1141 / JCM 9156 / N-4) TaxID=649639 RepID=E6TWD8_EVAC2|nr:gluconokinase [Evansella cellulosilytica]ADU31094.1 Carbohydrate kinase, FGGY-like protein [Evansella cellulosilytica DSM 2522]
MISKYVIGLDIGTTSAKAVTFTTGGEVIGEHEEDYSIIQPFPEWVEQDPYAIETAALSAIKLSIEKAGINSAQIVSIGISAAMHSLICMSKDGDALTNSITWADRRSVKQSTEVKASDLGNKIYLHTGTPIHPMSPLSKLLWMKENDFEPFKKAWKFVSIKEFLTYRWFNEAVVDYSIAAATGMFNIHKLDWDSETLEFVGLHKEQLSTPVPPTYVFETLRKDIANKMGVRENLPIVIGASDGPLANLGIGAIDAGDTAITIGTSGAIRQMASAPKTDSKQEVFCYSFTEDLWIFGGPTNNGGNVLHWMKQVLGEREVALSTESGEDPYELLTATASTVAPGSDGLIFLPFLYGERAPHWDANAHSSYVGLSSQHGKAHLLRAGLEGVMYNIYQINEALHQLAGTTKTLYASGGFSRSPLWLQILADIFGQEVHIPESHQSSAWGAAWVSLKAVNEVSSFSDIKRAIPMKDVIKPNMANNETYKNYYSIYNSLYQSLKPTFEKIAVLKTN